MKILIEDTKITEIALDLMNQYDPDYGGIEVFETATKAWLERCIDQLVEESNYYALTGASPFSSYWINALRKELE